jgi:hypothetical protein
VRSMDWTVVGVVSAAVAGVGGLAWKIWSDQRARRQDVEVRIESIYWRKERPVAIRVINNGDIVVRVVQVGCQMTSPSSSRTSEMPRWARGWRMGEGWAQGDLPKEIAPRDGHLFTLLMAPDSGGGPSESWKQHRVAPRAQNVRWAYVSAQAWAKISTGKTIYSPVFPSEQPLDTLRPQERRSLGR